MNDEQKRKIMEMAGSLQPFPSPDGQLSAVLKGQPVRLIPGRTPITETLAAASITFRAPWMNKPPGPSAEDHLRACGAKQAAERELMADLIRQQVAGMASLNSTLERFIDALDRNTLAIENAAIGDETDSWKAGDA